VEAGHAVGAGSAGELGGGGRATARMRTLRRSGMARSDGHFFWGRG
jgi:hypothetical protein